MNSNSSEKEIPNNTGFSSRTQAHNHRLLKRDGTFNIERRGLKGFNAADAYQNLIQMSWIKFIFIVLASYIFLNTFFAIIYFLVGTEHLTNTSVDSKWHQFLDAFFFSSQSLTTVGYGRVAPIGFGVSTIAALESMLGLLGFALATGLLYGRFSRPSAELLHSDKALITPNKDGAALMFRIANRRESQLIDVDVQVTYKRTTIENGNMTRHFIPLKLENHRMNMFPLSWTIVHDITTDSPFWGKTMKDFEEEDIEILVYFKGYDETFSNSVHSRHSYKVNEMKWGARFIPNFVDVSNGPTIHYLDKISDYEDAPLLDSDNAQSK